jgi:hypothetical protein
MDLTPPVLNQLRACLDIHAAELREGLRAVLLERTFPPHPRFKNGSAPSLDPKDARGTRLPAPCARPSLERAGDRVRRREAHRHLVRYASRGMWRGRGGSERRGLPKARTGRPVSTRREACQRRTLVNGVLEFLALVWLCVRVDLAAEALDG